MESTENNQRPKIQILATLSSGYRGLMPQVRHTWNNHPTPTSYR